MSAKDRLRKSRSCRFSRTSHGNSLTAEPFDPELVRLFATAAASRAMAMSRSADRSSTLSDGSYGRLGGAQSMAVPPRRYKRSSYSSGRSSAADDVHVRRSTSRTVEGSESDQPWSAALPSISEFGGLEDRIASLPSSYRRLRKSRSMFSTRQRSSHIPYSITSPESYSPSISSQGQPSDPPKLYRTLRRSMSFLKADNRPKSTLRHAKSQDASIQLARSRYQQDILNSPDSQSWQPLPMSKTRREHKPFRKTFRGTSATEDTTAEGSIEHIRTSQPHWKARALSSSIKKGIKRVLGLSRNPSAQSHECASPSASSHWGQSPSTGVSDENNYPSDYGNFDIDHQYAQVGQPPTICRMQSSRSLATSRSRVTSWADSTAANTIATPKTGGQRLSIVSEQGDLGPPEVPPLPSSSIRHDRSGIDSQRLFSALMKRIGGEYPHSSQENIVIGQVKEHRAIPTQGASHFHSSKNTIRQVPSEASISSPRSYATANPGSNEQQHDRNTVSCRSVGPSESHIDDSRVVEDDAHRPDSVSSSVYSRTTNGHSTRSRAATSSPDSAAEPGVATIYASERAAYSSPNKASESADDLPAQPSTDWQNWMDSQMARIENATPTRHYREDAEIYGDYAPHFTSSVPARRIRVESRGGAPAQAYDLPDRRVSTSSNFSRPFSRSSSLRTVVRAREPSSSIPTPGVPPLGDDVFRDSGDRGRSLKPQAGQSFSPMLARSSNQPRTVESPTPKRSATEVSPMMGSRKPGQPPTKWSPITPDARLLHRRSARFLRENRRATNENARIEQGMYDQAHGLQSSMSSKRMVEMFLNSRRRQMGVGSDDGTSEPAFL
ncbi:hypothetical protein BDV18DRAFT_160171 [Aspergillus unguis]